MKETEQKDFLIYETDSEGNKQTVRGVIECLTNDFFRGVIQATPGKLAPETTNKELHAWKPLLAFRPRSSMVKARQDVYAYLNAKRIRADGEPGGVRLTNKRRKGDCYAVYTVTE